MAQGWYSSAELRLSGAADRSPIFTPVRVYHVAERREVLQHDPDCVAPVSQQSFDFE